MIKNKCGALLVFVAQKLGTSNVQHIPRSISTLLSSQFLFLWLAATKLIFCSTKLIQYARCKLIADTEILILILIPDTYCEL